MAEVEFHLHNEVGIKFLPLRPAYTDGELYFGRFRGLVARSTGTSCIGEGGTGRIHLVRDELMEREVALKIPLESILRDPAARHDVIEETRQAMELTHPNIVRIHDFHETERLWGISMQYVRGKNLDEWRHEDASKSGHRRTIRPYSVDAIHDWIAQLCDALRYAHEDARMVHRDIKPNNLMLERQDGSEKMMITDFGITQRLRVHNLMLSRDQDRAGGTKGNMGTLPYMPWEQISGGSPSPLDDVYAVGATIYDLITGRPPFYEGGFEQIKVQIKETVPPRMEQRLADFGIPAAPIPEEWEIAVAACLAKRPEDRPKSVRELATALGFQSSSGTHLKSLIQSRDVRIYELEGRIETLTALEMDDAQTKQRLAELESELADERKEAAANRQKAQEAEQRNLVLASKLISAEGEFANARSSGDHQLENLKQESAKQISDLEEAVANARSEGKKLSEAALQDAFGKIARLEASIETAVDAAEKDSAERSRELESRLASAREEAGKDASAVSEELRIKADALSEKLRMLEVEREKTVARIREESEKRLKQQAEELNRARQIIEKAEADRKALDRKLAAERKRQPSSILPVLKIFAACVLFGLIAWALMGNFSKKSSPPVIKRDAIMSATDPLPGPKPQPSADEPESTSKPQELTHQDDLPARSDSEQASTKDQVPPQVPSAAGKKWEADFQNKFNLGEWYSTGRGVHSDLDKKGIVLPQDSEMKEWYWMAIYQGDTYFQGDADDEYRIGLRYYTGDGVRRNPAEAVKWFRIAAEHGNDTALWGLMICYVNREGIPGNSEGKKIIRADLIKWFRNNTEKEYPGYPLRKSLAQYYLGVCYYDASNDSDSNEGDRKKNSNEAVTWFLKAAREGNDPAQMMLGYHYRQANDDVEAAKWFEKAAEQENAEAQCNLGLFHYKGEGGKKNDFVLASQWFRKAADQGYPKAQYMLGVCFTNNQGVETDHVTAYKWYSIAAKGGVTQAKEQLDIIGKKMNEEQKMKAREMIQEFKRNRD